VLALVASTAAAQHADADVSLSLPLACTPGETCWISNYVDHDPGAGVRDYTCGGAAYNVKSKHGDRHLGTDFALRDLAAMRAGVDVLAAAPGVVAGVRADMQDIDASTIDATTLKGKLCGNGLVIEHAGGFTTQYCHLRQNSITLKQGETVARGQKIGRVGLSGFTQYPHLHVTVRRGDTVIDPFVGLARKEKCGLGDRPLWRPDVLARLPYGPSALYTMGFAGEKPTPQKARAGQYRDAVIARDAPVFILWLDAFQVRAGDELVLTIIGPDGKPFLRSAKTLKKKYARAFNFAGKRLKTSILSPGTYTGIATLTRTRPEPGQKTFTRRITTVVK
jgi:hypothetical protein